MLWTVRPSPMTSSPLLSALLWLFWSWLFLLPMLLAAGGIGKEDMKVFSFNEVILLMNYLCLALIAYHKKNLNIILHQNTCLSE